MGDFVVGIRRDTGKLEVREVKEPRPEARGPDPRLPAVGTITHGTRQQRRRITRRKTPCCRCGGTLQATDDLCIDNGRDAHLGCSERRNEALADAAIELREQDEREARERAQWLGLVEPGAALWTPPKTIPKETQALTPEIDLSQGVLLGQGS